MSPTIIKTKSDVLKINPNLKILWENPKKLHKTYLYIGSYPGDTGQRPINMGSKRIWFSSEIRIYDSSRNNAHYFEKDATYIIECDISNSGGLDAPIATVDVFLSKPPLFVLLPFLRRIYVSFPKRRISNSKCIGIKSIDVSAASLDGTPSTTMISFQYTATEEDVGNKSLFIRVFSLSPLDVPEDFDLLSPKMDRHVAHRLLKV